MKKAVVLNVSLVIAVIALLVVIVLYLELAQYDPYSWAFPGRESELSRSLWLKRRSLYERVALIVIVLGSLLGLIKIVSNRRPKRIAK